MRFSVILTEAIAQWKDLYTEFPELPNFEGVRRSDAARIGGMDRQTLRDWVIRYNEGGVDALINQEKVPAVGYRGKLSPEQQQFLIETIEMGPLPDIHETVRWRHWRLVDLCKIIRNEFGISFSQSGMRHVVVRFGYSHITARPRSVTQYTTQAFNFRFGTAFSQVCFAWSG